MTYTAQQLITEAWYRSGIVARNNQSVTGDQIHVGLGLLNEILDFQTIDHDLIPFWTYDQSITTDAGEENYFIDNCLSIESVTFNIDTVRYPMDSVTRRKYYGSARVDNISSLPFSYNFNREKGGGTLSLYFKPAGEYPLKIMAKFGLVDVSLNTDISEQYEGGYISYLKFYLARYMCMEYSISFPEEASKLLTSLIRKLMYVSPPDLSMKKTSMLQQQPGILWADINIGMGWRPS